ncbi:MAG: helix-turn-helix domain-containing protein [Pseudomonadales bacterium]
MLAHHGLITSPGTIPAIDVLHAQEVALEHGKDLTELALKAGVPLAALRGDIHEVSYQAYSEMIDLALQRFDIPAYGYLVGRKFTVADQGVLGYAIISSATVREGLEIYLRFQNIVGVDAANEETMRIDDEYVIISSPVFTPDNSRLNCYFTEFNLGQWEAGDEETYPNTGFNPVTVKLACPKPSYAVLLEQNIPCAIQYNQTANEFSFPVSFLDQPRQLADEVVAHLCEQQCDTALKSLQYRGGIAEQILRYIVKHQNHSPDPETVARYLDISYRTLRRKLQEEGTTFQQICLQARMKLATQYLSQSQLSIDQIAELVGYKEPSTFRSAFKKHFGQPPRKYRQQYRSNKIGQ